MKRRIRLIENGQPIATYDSLSDCARLRGWNKSTVGMALTRKTRTHGYDIEYYDCKETENVKSIFMRKPFT